MSNKIKVYVEVDKNLLFDVDKNNLDEIFFVRKQLLSQIADAALEKLLKEVEIPKIDIDQDELRERVMNRMADRIIEDKLGDND